MEEKTDRYKKEGDREKIGSLPEGGKKRKEKGGRWREYQTVEE